MKTSTTLAMIAGLALLVWVVFLYPGLYGTPRVPHKVPTCLSSVKQQALAVLIYAGDNEDRFVPRQRWMDTTSAYLKNEDLRHCPSVAKGAYGYAYNAGLSGLRQAELGLPEIVPMVYDSIRSARNASDSLLSFPNPGRHKGQDNVAYADGHAKRVPAKVAQ